MVLSASPTDAATRRVIRFATLRAWFPPNMHDQIVAEQDRRHQLLSTVLLNGQTLRDVLQFGAYELENVQ